MDCAGLREKFLETDEAALRAHAASCADCAEWLRREERLTGLLCDLRAEASIKTASLAGRIKRPDARPVMRVLPKLAFSLAAAAVIIIAGAVFFRQENGTKKPELVATRILVIEGRVRDDAAPPEYVEIDGKKFPVQRVSATEGLWRVEVPIDRAEQNLVLTAIDPSGNRSGLNVHINR